MQHQPKGDCLWGTIRVCVNIASDVYTVSAADQNGMEREGIMVRKSAAGDILSEKAIKMGQEDGPWLCYGEETRDIPLYEILQRRMAECKKAEAVIMKQMEEIRRDGRLSLTDYFGECEEPKETPDGGLSGVRRVRNGIYLVQDCRGLKFAVQEAVADYFLSPMAAGYGVRKEEYLYYDIDGGCAVALNELSNVFEEAEALICSRESLYATLNRYFAGYTALYNLCMPETERIPESDADIPAFRFLAL